MRTLPSLPTLRAGPEAHLAPASALLSLVGPLFLLIRRASVPARSAPQTSGPVPEAIAPPRMGHASSGQHRRISGDNRARVACTCRKTAGYGQLLARLTHTF